MVMEDFFEQALKDFEAAIDRVKYFIDIDNLTEASNDIRHAALEVDGLEENNPGRAQSLAVRDVLGMAQAALGGCNLGKKDSLRRAREHWETATQKARREQDREWVAGHLSQVQKKWKGKLNALWESIGDLMKVGSTEALKEAEAKILVGKDEDPTNSAWDWDKKLAEVRQPMKEGIKPGEEAKLVAGDFINIRSRIESLVQRAHYHSSVQLMDEAAELAEKAVENFKNLPELYQMALGLRNQVLLARDDLRNSLDMEIKGWDALKKGNMLEARSSFENALINVAESSPRYKPIKRALNKVENAAALVEEATRDEAAGMLTPAIRKLAQAKTLLGAPWVQIPWFDEALTHLEGKQRIKELEAELEKAEFNLNLDNLRSVLNLLQRVETQPGVSREAVKTQWQRYRTLRETFVSSMLQQAKDEERKARLEQAIALIGKVVPLYTEEELAATEYRNLESQQSQWQGRLLELERLLQSGRRMLSEGNWEAAVTFYSRALEVIANRPDAQEGLEIARGLQRTKLMLHDHPDRGRLKAAVKNMKQWGTLASFQSLFAEKPYFSAQLKEAEETLKKANRRLWKLTGIFSGVGVVIAASVVFALIRIPIIVPPPPPPPPPTVVTTAAEVLPLPLNPDRPMPTSDVRSYDRDKVEVYEKDSPGRVRVLKNEPDGTYFRNKYIEMFNNDPNHRGLGKFVRERLSDNGLELVFERGTIVWYRELKRVVGSWY